MSETEPPPPSKSFLSQLLVGRSAGSKKKPTLRKRLRNIGLFLGLFFILPLLVIWLYIAQPTSSSSARSDAAVSPARLEKHVRMLSETFSPRSFVHFKNLNATADYIYSEFEALNSGGVLEDQVFDLKSHRYRNISLLLNATSEEPRIVIGAHYDGYGPHPAADDNASGVAGMIELARLIAADKSFTQPIEFVGYPLEEPPHFGSDEMGSAFHARDLKKAETAVKLMVSLEMIGYFVDERGTQGYPHLVLKFIYPSRGNYVAIVSRTDMRDVIKSFKIGMKGTTDLPVYSIAAPAAIPGVDFSDHRNYWKEGYPAIMITDTAFYRNRKYHTPEDTADRLDYDRMAQVVIAVFEALKKVE